MKNLLIVSTFGPDATADWKDIQQCFIDRYTTNYDYAVYLHEVEESAFDDCKILGRTEGVLLHALPEMFNNIYKYFRTHEYENYLLLDSDCFPIKHNWQKKLNKVMGDKWYAAPVRTDNLDTFPHPCALYIKGEHVAKPIFSFDRKVNFMQNLRGEEVFDIGTGFKTEFDGQHILFPLVRSNFLNAHPMLAAIYGDMFYHHGAGSRTPFFRSTSYWRSLVSDYEEAGQRCFDWVQEDPDGFIAMLRGEGLVHNPEMLKEFFLTGW